MSLCSAPSLFRAAKGTSPFSLLSLLAGAFLLAAAPRPAAAQNVESLLQQPGVASMLRSRIQQSGLTAEQIRARLTAAGYAGNLLDAYLDAGSTVAPEPGAQVLAAAAALGLAVPTAAPLSVDTGFLRRAPLPHSRVFGVDALRRTTTQFLPLLSGPVPPDYKLGAGDELVLILTGDVELAYTLPVTREGFIVIPQVGQVFVSNLSLEQLRTVLYARLGRVYSGVRRSANATTHFDVSVANVRVNQVYVVGEVTQPGAYQISSLGTVLTALYAAGGVTERANTRTIEVRRGAETRTEFDLYDYLLRGNTRHDQRLETGDVVFVPVHGVRADVTGAVVRPAIYDLKADESLGDLLAAAGGFRADAKLQRVTVHRILPVAQQGPGRPPRAAVTVDLTSAATMPGIVGRGERGEGRSGAVLSGVIVPPLSLVDGDSVVVDSVPPLFQEPWVAIKGRVHKPGLYPWRAGMALRDLVRLAGGPRVGADLRYAELARLPADRSQGQISVTSRVQLDSSYLSERDSTGRYRGAAGVAFPPAGSAPEVTLEPYDDVLILRQPDFELQQNVFVGGEVLYPGSYALSSKSERLTEILARAGGLTPQAYAEGIRFYRGGASGRVNVDLPRAMQEKTSRDNLLLQPGDSIDIPEYQPSVRVFGAVNSAGNVLYRKGAGLDYYLSAAGGFARNADEGRVSVRLANGEVRTKSKWLFFSRKPDPGPGAEVFVPFKDPADKTDYVALVGSIAQILASTVAIIVVVTR